MRSSGMDVMKFGAVSVGEAARLRGMGRLVKEAHADGRALVVVCAALGGITDKLIGAARAAATGHEAVGAEGRRERWGRCRALAEKLAADDWQREARRRECGDLLKARWRFTRPIASLGEH